MHIEPALGEDTHVKPQIHSRGSSRYEPFQIIIHYSKAANGLHYASGLCCAHVMGSSDVFQISVSVLGLWLYVYVALELLTCDSNRFRTKE